MNVLDAAYNTVRNYKGGAAALAPRLGMLQAILNSKVNPNTTTHHLRLDEADKLMGITGDYSILHAMSYGHGFINVPLSSAAPDIEMEQVSLIEMLLQLGESKGEICTVLRAAWADGQITHGEAVDIEAAITQMVQKLETLRMNVRNCIEEGHDEKTTK